MVQNILDATFWDKAMIRLRRGEDVAETVDALVWELYSIRQRSSPEVWKDFATITCRQHSIMPLLHQDPFTWRAFSKPRGYAGDAQMLDFIYAPEDGFSLPALEEASELGRQICRYTSNGAAPQAVRA